MFKSTKRSCPPPNVGPLDSPLKMACDLMVTTVLNGSKFSELRREKINAFEVVP